MRRATREDYERRILRVQQALAERLDDAVAPAELVRVASLSLHQYTA